MGGPGRKVRVRDPDRVVSTGFGEGLFGRLGFGHCVSSLVVVMFGVEDPSRSLVLDDPDLYPGQ